LEEAEHWIASRPAGAPAPTEGTQSFIAESRRAATQTQRLTLALSLVAAVVGFGSATLAYWRRGVAIEQQKVVSEQRRLAEEQRDLAQRSGVLRDLANWQRVNGCAAIWILHCGFLSTQHGSVRACKIGPGLISVV
jgi:hypothetical protein